MADRLEGLRKKGLQAPGVCHHFSSHYKQIFLFTPNRTCIILRPFFLTEHRAHPGVRKVQPPPNLDLFLHRIFPEGLAGRCLSNEFLLLMFFPVFIPHPL